MTGLYPPSPTLIREKFWLLWKNSHLGWKSHLIFFLTYLCTSGKKLLFSSFLKLIVYFKNLKKQRTKLWNIFNWNWFGISDFFELSPLVWNSEILELDPDVLCLHHFKIEGASLSQLKSTLKKGLPAYSNFLLYREISI